MSKRTNYRRIWQKHNGAIPTDTEGRTFDIHHADNDCTNNDIANLIALSLKEHYDIHYAQKDYAACHAISIRLQLSAVEHATIHKLSAKLRTGIPRPDMIGSLNPMYKLGVAEKVSIWQKANPKTQQHCDSISTSAKSRAKNKIICTYCSKETNDVNYSRWHGDNCLLNPNNTNLQRITNFSTNNPSNIKTHCIHCARDIGGIRNYNKWHGDKCKGKR